MFAHFADFQNIVSLFLKHSLWPPKQSSVCYLSVSSTVYM